MKKVIAKEKIVYLRVLYKAERFGITQTLNIFDGDIKKDRVYWKKHHNIKARYFKLEEIKKNV